MTGEEQMRGNRLPLADKNKWGYDIDQVDEFLDRAHQLYDAPQPQLNQEDIQNVLFTLVRGGYDIEAVDRALLRLEQAAVDKQTSYEISSEGRVAWRTKTVQLAQTLMPRANADNGYRFADGHGKEPSYDRKQVDSFVVNAVTRICDELGIEYPQAVSSSNFDSDEDFTPRYVSTILFTQRKGDRGYDEGQVDMYVNRISQVVSRIVSFRNFEGADVKDALDGSAFVRMKPAGRMPSMKMLLLWKNQFLLRTRRRDRQRFPAVLQIQVIRQAALVQPFPMDQLFPTAPPLKRCIRMRVRCQCLLPLRAARREVPIRSIRRV